MRNSFIFLLLLFSSAIIELSLIHTFSYPFFLFPLCIGIGSILFHMLSIEFGILWFLFMPIILKCFGSGNISFTAYLLTAGIGALLTLRFFTRRSVYALLGLGSILLITYYVIEMIVGKDPFAHHAIMQSFIWSEGGLALFLSISFILIQKLRPFGSLFT